MKELYVFTRAGDREKLVRQLGELGVVDLSSTRTNGNAADPWKDEIDRTEKVIQLLDFFRKDGKNKNRHKPVNPTGNSEVSIDICRVLQASVGLEKVNGELEELGRMQETLSFWGDYPEKKDMDYLASRGLFVRLYLLNRPCRLPSSQERAIIRLRKKKGKYPVVLIAREESEQLDAPEVELPDIGPSQWRERVSRRNRQKKVFRAFLNEQTKELDRFKEYREFLEELRQTQLTLNGTGEVSRRICYVHGFIPSDCIHAFERTAGENRWGYSYKVPENPERVPVYIRNPRWVRTIEPLMKFIDIIPGYKEMDVSVFFLFAFILFFAMLVGDAGYGVLFLLATLLLKRKIGPQGHSLGVVLSVGTIVWGVLSGTYFGSPDLAEIPILRQLRVDSLASFGQDNSAELMHLTFIIGAIHLSLARLVRMVQSLYSIRFLRELGWIALIWGLFMLTQQLVLGMELPSWGTGLLIGGAAGVLLGSIEKGRLGGSLGAALTNLPFDLINSFSDIVSYVRLFAVGMATAWVAASFNDMILPGITEESSIWIHVVLIIALCLGHSLNIALALMAVMVHGIRLNMLEFSGQLGVQFSGIAYRPFRLKYPERVMQVLSRNTSKSLTKKEKT